MSLSNGIVLALQSNNLCFTQCHNLNEANKQKSNEKYDLIILDINLPDGNGLDFLRDFKQTFNTPVILLTANDIETDIVTGLEMGADDYITKPFSLAVLRARVNTQLRKVTSLQQKNIIIDGFNFDFENMQFLKLNKPVELSKTEQKLLRILIENRGIIVSRSDLVDKIWTDGMEYVDENALSVTVKRLRDKLENIPSTPKYIKTVYGIGYTWAVK